MRFKMLHRIWNAFYCILLVVVSCDSQDNALLSPGSFRVISRMFMPVPEGRKATMDDVRILHYGRNLTNPKIYHFKDITLLLSDPYFDTGKTTMLYAHGYGEVPSDDNVLYFVRSYLENGGYNTLVLDWGNYAFGSYVSAGLKLLPVGEEAGKALSKVIRAGLPLDRLHLIGHSMGAHLMAAASRKLASLGHTVRRLTALDAAFPGFYPPLQILSPPISSSDAQFVDAIHTDGGWFGTPYATGHADFWPNGGRAKQPGCLAFSIPVTSEDFCSHWRSWRFWCEALNGGEFLARKCDSYDTFQQGRCRGEELVHMGIKATPDLRGNYYLKTASKQPYALGESGAE